MSNANGDFERIVTMRPAFDRRHKDPHKNYGIHGVELRMVLRGAKGATQFLLYTNWQLPHVTEETHRRHLHGTDLLGLHCSYDPIPADKGYHWATPQYDGQEDRDCDVLPGGKCFYDGSSLNADEIFQLLLTEGSEGVWKGLEDFYHDLCASQPTA